MNSIDDEVLLDVRELLDDLAEQGGKLHLPGGTVRVSAPLGVLTDDERRTLTDQAAGVYEYLDRGARLSQLVGDVHHLHDGLKEVTMGLEELIISDELAHYGLQRDVIKVEDA